MAIYDSADLLARTRRALRLPSLDQPEVDAQLYQYLEEAQTFWLSRVAALIPETNYSTPIKLTSSDGGYTYDLPSEPLGGHMEILPDRRGSPLFPTTDWGQGDFVMEGQKIRIPGNRTRTFADGPYARFVATPGLLDGSNQPVLKPTFLRLLLPQRAAAIYARNTEGRDPRPYLDIEGELWRGDPSRGDIGFLDTLKTQYAYSGAVGADIYSGDWWHNSPDLR